MGRQLYVTTLINRWSIVVAITAALAAFLLVPSRQAASPIDAPRSYVSGKNNTALFLVSEHPGLSNVHLATAQSLLELHPDVHLHFASFPPLEKRLTRLSTLAQARQPKANNIVFHPLSKARSYGEAVRSSKGGSDYYDADGLKSLITPPGKAGVERLIRDMQTFVSPWTAEEHFAVYQEIAALINNVDPAVVVLDTLLSPAVEATRDNNRMHAFITPNTIIDNFRTEQPNGEMFWKFPSLGSGFAYPVPWNKIFMNVYLNFKIVAGILNMPHVSAKRAFLSGKGISSPIQFYGLHRPEIPWITQNTPGASIPVKVIPPNVTSAGPMSISPVSAEEEDLELVNWIKQKPTVLINLGTAHEYSMGQTKEFISGIQHVLESSPDLQILWKYKVAAPFKDMYDWKEAMKPLTDTARVRVSTWLKLDPPSLLQTGYIVASVTHGGAGGYHESLEAGVPQIVLPQWVDHYNYAQLAEQIGVGVWACRGTAPLVRSDCLSRGILKVASNNQSDIIANAARWGERVREKPGRDTSAGIIAKLARLGV